MMSYYRLNQKNKHLALFFFTFHLQALTKSEVKRAELNYKRFGQGSQTYFSASGACDEESSWRRYFAWHFLSILRLIFMAIRICEPVTDQGCRAIYLFDLEATAT